MTPIARPANAVWCTCEKGWHLTFTAQQRCPNRQPSPGIRAAALADLKPKTRRRVR